MVTQNDIKKMLDELLNNLTEGFEQDELAYLTVQGKNELQIRDKIAWCMHCKLQNMKGAEHIIVRREWKPSDTDRHQVDLAILKLYNNDTEVEGCLALIEFKAQSIVRPEKWYIDEFVKDVAKMKNICSTNKNCADSDMYFVFLHSAQNNYDKKICHASQKYYNNKTTICKSETDDECIKAMEEEWKKFFEKADGRYKKGNHILEIKNKKFQTPEPKIQYLGEAYGIKCFTAAMIWGPVKKGDVAIDGE